VAITQISNKQSQTILQQMENQEVSVKKTEASKEPKGKFKTENHSN
jgi:hypothetical protein